MDISMQYLSFFVIQSESEEPEAAKTYRHYQTLHRESYESSELKDFLHGELERILKRKAERNPKTEQAPTKIGRFFVEPGHELTSNPNYNLFRRLREASTREDFQAVSDDLIRTYLNTSAVRGGAFIVASAKLPKYFDEPFVFVLKCDFEPKIARIADEKSLVSQVEMAISARSIKSIQYPYMPEPGMLEEEELKIHQASHARYFEDFLKYVTYEKSKPAIVTEQMLDMVQEYMDAKWRGGGEAGYALEAAEESAGAEALPAGVVPEPVPHSSGEAGEDAPPWVEADDADPLRADVDPLAGETAGAPVRVQASPAVQARRREEERLEIWAAGDKRELQQRWSHDQVAEAAQRIAETQPEYEMNFKLDAVNIRAKVEEYGKSVHIARLNGRYVVLIEGDVFRFDKGISPIELLAPEPFEEVVARMAEEADRRTVAEREERWRDRAERRQAEAPAAGRPGENLPGGAKAEDRMDAQPSRADRLPWE